jgi:WD40 repeat protein
MIMRTPIEHAATVYSLSISPDSSLLAYADEARVVMLDLLSGEVIWTYSDPYPNQVYSLSFSPDGSCLLARHIHAVLLDSTNGHVVHDFAPLEVQGAVFPPDGKTILFSLYSGLVSGFTTDLGACVHQVDEFTPDLHRVERFYPFPGETPSLVSMHSSGSHIPPGLSRLYSSADSRFIALTHGDGFIEVWDLSTGEVPAFGIAEHYMMIHDLIFHDSIMLSGSEDGRVMIFDLNLGQLRIAHTLGSPVSRLEISPDGSKAMALHEGNMKATVVSTVSGGVLFVLDGKGSPIVDMGFSEDGTQSVIITENGRVWVGQIFTDFKELLESSQARVQQQ